MTQLIFQWGAIGASPTETWVPTEGTATAAAHLPQLAQTGGCLCVYGPEGAGKSHFLAYAATQYPTLTTADNLDTAPLTTQETLFHTFNAAKAEGRGVLVASRTPIAQCQLLPDLKSRLLTGLQVELTLPTDAELRTLLIRWAEARQVHLPDTVSTYILARAERNPHTLAALVARLDTLSLEQKRAVTIPLARELGI